MYFTPQIFWHCDTIFWENLQKFCLFQTKLWTWIQLFQNWDKSVEHLIHFLTLLDMKVIVAATITVLWHNFWIQFTKSSNLRDKFVILTTKFSALWIKNLQQLTKISTLWHDVVLRVSNFLTLQMRIILHITMFLTSRERFVITTTFF